MTLTKRPRKIATATLIFLPLGTLGGPGQNVSPRECEWTRKTQIYSRAYYVEEAGDVVGEELALWVHEDNSVEARLYDYEGAPNTDGIRVAGKISGKKLDLQGDWVQRVIEEPSHQEAVQTVHVEVTGTMDGLLFRGRIRISGVTTRVTMKRVNHIWMCHESK